MVLLAVDIFADAAGRDATSQQERSVAGGRE